MDRHITVGLATLRHRRSGKAHGTARLVGMTPRAAAASSTGDHLVGLGLGDLFASSSAVDCFLRCACWLTWTCKELQYVEVDFQDQQFVRLVPPELPDEKHRFLRASRRSRRYDSRIDDQMLVGIGSGRMAERRGPVEYPRPDHGEFGHSRLDQQ